MKDPILERFNRGDLARAYDLCLAALKEEPDNLWLRHRAVLCLVRSGALERAIEDFNRFRLSDARHDEDCLALSARLLKTMALETEPSQFPVLTKLCAAKYAEVFDQTKGHYPGINAASMSMLAGDEERAQYLASRVLDLCRRPVPTDSEKAYYHNASEAEAYLLLGESAAAHIAFRHAIAKDPDNVLAHATTLRQFRLIAAHTDIKAPWIDDLTLPRPCHYAGHLFHLGDRAGQVDAGKEKDLAGQIADVFEREDIGPMYGAMAAGSDIMIAEAALRRGNEVHAVLPVPVNVFIDASVRPLGRDWIKRCEACLDRVEAIHEVTSDRTLLSARHIRFASEVAMGMARMRADTLATKPLQLLIWDGVESAERSGGTAIDADIWRSAGLYQVILPFEPEDRYRADTDPVKVPLTDSRVQDLRAMLFADVRGSSTVPDDKVPNFVEHVLGQLADVCRELDEVILEANSWGDGLFLASETAAQAATVATALQKRFAGLDLEALDLPAELGLRIGAHYGPVFKSEHPLQSKPSLFGGQVTLAARLEPVAVPGSIMVSQTFAAILAMEAGDRFRCEYVGQRRIDSLLPEQELFCLRAVAPGSPASLQSQTTSDFAVEFSKQTH